MGKIFTLVLIFSANLLAGQDIVYKLVSKATCDCMPHVLEVSTGSEDISDCFMRSIGKDSIALQTELEKRYGAQAEEKFYQIGQEYFNSHAVALVDSCDAYFHIMDTIRLRNVRALNKDSLQEVLNKFNSNQDYIKDTNFYYNRGLCYFSLGDYPNALKDFKLSSGNARNINKMNFVALSAEFANEFDEAIAMYNKLATLTKAKEYKIFAAIAKRKKNRL